MKPYQHPITFKSSGNLALDYQFAFADYETNLTPYLPADRAAKILDIGCGWGQFLSWLKQKNFHNLEGIDVGADQIEHCRSIGLNASCATDSLLFLREKSETYDFITLHHVIEHMPPTIGIELLKAICHSLRPGGTAIIQTPNMSSISAGFSRFIEVTHVTGYTDSSLHEALLLGGLPTWWFLVLEHHSNSLPNGSHGWACNPVFACCGEQRYFQNLDPMLHVS